MRIFNAESCRDIFKMILRMLSLLLAVSIIAFALVCFSPVDPVQQYILGMGTAVSPERRAAIEEYWGVDQPPVQRYMNWLGKLLRGDLGESALYRRPVADIIGERFFNSLALMFCAWLFAGLIGFALGCVMGMYQDRLPDKLLISCHCSNKHLINELWIFIKVLLYSSCLI